MESDDVRKTFGSTKPGGVRERSWALIDMLTMRSLRSLRVEVSMEACDCALVNAGDRGLGGVAPSKTGGQGKVRGRPLTWQGDG